MSDSPESALVFRHPQGPEGRHLGPLGRQRGFGREDNAHRGRCWRGVGISKGDLS